MTDLLTAAWNGWENMNAAGKLSGALLISLVLLWVYSKRVAQKTFLIYTTAATAACILPFTAAGLMLYQTKFYDYEWIWSIVPVTAMIALALTLFFTEFLREITDGKRKTEAAVGLLVLAGLLFCGDLGVKSWSGTREDAECEELLTVLHDRMEGKQIYLWAPQEIMGYARQADASVLLIYGRDMWDPYLSGYTYDVYPEEIRELYDWMETGEWEEQEIADDCAEAARLAGVNCVLIPDYRAEETVKYLEELFGATAERIGAYYLLTASAAG